MARLQKTCVRGGVGGLLPLAAVVVLGIWAVAARAEESPGRAFTGRVEDRNRICMMQDSMQPKAGLAHEHGGKTYWLCCEMCVQAFDSDPERYAHAKDPVNGASVDKATAPVYAVDGRVFFFSSEKTLAAFAAHPGLYLHGG